MSHVDKGALHAYLDGALDEYPAAEASRVRNHLESCAQCAIMLEAERRVRAEAKDVLALAVPAVDMPSFEELRAYVKATRVTPSAASVRLYRLGWAASVVLALGAGWIVRGGQLGTLSSPELTGSFSAAAEAAAGARSADAEREALAQERDAAPPAPQLQADAFADVSEEVASREVVSTVVGRQVGAEQLEGRVAPDAEPSRKVGVDLPAVASPTMVAEAVVAEVEAPPAEPSAESVVADDLSDRDVVGIRLEEAVFAADVAGRADSLGERTDLSAAGAGVGGTAGVTSNAAVASLPVDELRSVADSNALDARANDPATAQPTEEQAPEVRRRAESLAPATARMQLDPVASAGLRAPEEEPKELSSGGSFAVPGLEVLSIDNLVEGTTPGGVRYVQRLEDGGLLEVIHLPEGDELTGLPPLPDGYNEVRGRRDGAWVVLRAALDTEALQALLARLDPEG